LADTPDAFGSTYAAEVGRAREWWTESATRLAWFIADTGDGAAVGLVAGVAPSDATAAREVISMWVAAHCRGRGVATALLDAVERWARAGGATALLLRVSDRNVRARRFYARQGFVPTGDVEPLRSDPSALALQMRRELPRARLRFAPRSAGHLHPGHVRAAVLTYAVSRPLSGDYFVRFEDTNLAAVDEQGRQGTCGDLAWLGLLGDETPHQQHELTDAHRSALARLASHTYRDGAAVRLRLPGEAEEWDDLALGRVCVRCADISDPVLTRSDGSPTFFLASTVDDVVDRVTHLVRIDSMVRATAVQRAVWRALDVAPPCTAHIPVLRSHAGAPLRARGAPVTIPALRARGVRPEALLLYLAMPKTASSKHPPPNLAAVLDQIDLRWLPRRPHVFDLGSLARLSRRLDRLYPEGA
jgi:GNAT superfamily N-acetyltransferase